MTEQDWRREVEESITILARISVGAFLIASVAFSLSLIAFFLKG